MRAVVARVFCGLLTSLLIAGLIACGGGRAPLTTLQAGIPATATMNPASASLVFGDVIHLVVSASDANGTVLTSPKITFSSSNPNVANVSSSGLVCAGTWDAQFIVCNKTNQTGTATITATVESSQLNKAGQALATSTIAVHQRIGSIVLTPGSVNCVSLNGTQQMSAAVKDANGNDITSLVGPINWNTADSTVATIDTNGLVTAKEPGITSVSAFVGVVASLPAPFTTCPVKSISIHLSGSFATSFTVGQSGSQTLVADVLDANNNSISPTLQWFTDQPFVAGVNSSGIVSGNQPGFAGISVSCTPPACNKGLDPIYSNLAVAQVTGNIGGYTIYASGTNTSSIVPIVVANSQATPGTPIGIPAGDANPNSFVMNRQVTLGYLGSSGSAAELMGFNVGNSTISNLAAISGKVLAVSPDGNRVIDADTNALTVVGFGGNASVSLNIANAVAADWLPDSSKAFIVTGQTAALPPTLYVYQAGSALKTFPLTVPANDVRSLPNGAFVYLAGGAPSAVMVRAGCDGSLADTVATPAIPSLIRPLPNGTAVVGADPQGSVDIITPNSALVGCPPAVTDAVASKNLGFGSFTPVAMLVLPNSSKVYIATSDQGLLVFDLTTMTGSKLPLAGGAMPVSLGVTNDSNNLIVGGNDSKIHIINVPTATDTGQVSVSFVPNLLAVRTQ